LSPFRQQTPREFCVELVPLEIPEIESDGSEVSVLRCDRVAVGSCRSCERPVCERHRQDEELCARCRESDAGALEPKAASPIARRERRFSVGPIALTEAVAFLVGLSIGSPWIGAKLVLLVVVIRLAIHSRSRERAG
jgi:hypothetical protein